MPDGGISPDAQANRPPNPNILKNKKVRRALELLVLALTITGCTETDKIDVQSKVLETLANGDTSAEIMNLANESQEINMDGLETEVIEPGDSIITAIDKHDGVEGSFNTYANLALGVNRGDLAILFENKRAIEFSGLVGGIAGVQPGDELFWGKREDVLNRVGEPDEDVLVLNGERKNCSADGKCFNSLSASGGVIKDPMYFFYMEGVSNQWRVEVGDRAYDQPDFDEAIIDAQTAGPPPNT